MAFRKRGVYRCERCGAACTTHIEYAYDADTRDRAWCPACQQTVTVRSDPV